MKALIFILSFAITSIINFTQKEYNNIPVYVYLLIVVFVIVGLATFVFLIGLMLANKDTVQAPF